MAKIHINPDLVPISVKEAAEIIANGADAETKAMFVESPSILHLGLGMQVRNAWSFWEPDTPLKRDAIETYKIAHADDISGLVFEWARNMILGNKDFNPVAYCDNFHAHWAKIGKTSIEAGTPS
jgi:hypothetical protein